MSTGRRRAVHARGVAHSAGAHFSTSARPRRRRPDYAPGVGTPVRGGLSYREAHFAWSSSRSPVSRLARVVEVNPIVDRENATGSSRSSSSRPRSARGFSRGRCQALAWHRMRALQRLAPKDRPAVDLGARYELALPARLLADHARGRVRHEDRHEAVLSCVIARRRIVMSTSCVRRLVPSPAQPSGTSSPFPDGS